MGNHWFPMVLTRKMKKLKPNVLQKTKSCMRRNSLLVVLVLCFTAAAQHTEETLKPLGNEYLKPSNSAISDSLANLFADSLWAFISIESNFGVPLNKVNNLSVQLPDDKRIIELEKYTGMKLEITKIKIY